MTTKKDIFERYLNEYLKANRARKGEILDTVTDVARMHRKAAVRKFRALQMRDPARPDRRGRPARYGPDVTAALKEVWKAANEPCGENPHAAIAGFVSALRRDGMWKWGGDTAERLLAMSVGTVKVRVAGFSRERRSFGGGRSTTRPGSILSAIPIRSGGWREAPAGQMQVDTVAHCGESTAGDYRSTVNGTCEATLWGARRAQWNEGAAATAESMRRIEGGTPFPVLEWHPDTGSEFINWHLKRQCDGRGIRMTRSRPNRKNDNCLVEERNGHVVRPYVGCARLDFPESVGLLDDVYEVLDPYLNHFCASRRIVSKERVGAKWKVKREKVALTPYQRVMAREDVDGRVKSRLREDHERLNPLVLKREIDRRLKLLFDAWRRHGTDSHR